MCVFVGVCVFLGGCRHYECVPILASPVSPPPASGPWTGSGAFPVEWASHGAPTRPQLVELIGHVSAGG